MHSQVKKWAKRVIAVLLIPFGIGVAGGTKHEQADIRLPFGDHFVCVDCSVEPPAPAKHWLEELGFTDGGW